MVSFSSMGGGIFCLSTDEKPTEGIANGAKLTEIDTGKTYRFNAEGGEYVEYEESGSGGSDDPYAGYDLVFLTTSTNLSDISTSNTTLESGTFAAAYAKALAGEKLSIRFHGYAYESDEEIYSCDYDVSGVYADIGYNDGIRFLITGGYLSGGLPYNEFYASNASGGPNTVGYYAYSRSPVRVWLTESGIAIDRIS